MNTKMRKYIIGALLLHAKGSVCHAFMYAKSKLHSNLYIYIQYCICIGMNEDALLYGILLSVFALPDLGSNTI